MRLDFAWISQCGLQIMYIYIYMSVCVKRCGKVLGRCLEIELVLHTDRIRSRKLLRGMQGGNGSFVVWPSWSLA